MMFDTPIVSVDWLKENLDLKDLILLDATIPKVGQKWDDIENRSFIAGSQFMDLKNDFTDLQSPLPNTVPSTELFEKSARKLGINNDSIIVVYDAHGIYSSPRAYWLFRYMGHNQVAVLDGGLPSWKEADLPLEDQPAVTSALGNFKAKLIADRIVDYQEVKAIMEDKKYQIIDARSHGRFTATVPEPRKEIRGGHIPGSTNIPYAKLLDQGKLIDKAELEKAFSEAEANETNNRIFSCGSGITACVLAWAADVSGLKNNAVYDGSWTEWGSREELPIEK